MIQTFERDGIRLQYPTSWTLETGEAEAPGAGEWSVTLQSSGTAFMLISLRPDADGPADLADQALDALKAEYKELDADNVVETVAGQVAIGHDIDFLTLDTPITCWTRALDTPAGPLLVMGQTSEFDRADHAPVLRAILASLTVDEE